ncbi:hypothetical protein KSP39_PZI013148 [Platanthera zijinensis]|uniref:Uncharacterized protein n=1 Tax=Platanthera zijinensis TaxID=2320716 RepID=A0AAP0BD87_9ASPA
MEENSGKMDLHGNLLRLNSTRAPASLKSSFDRSVSRNSPSFRRLQSTRAPRRDFKAGSGKLQWIRSNRVVFWLLLITMWAYIGFHVQSSWAHSDHRKKEFVGYKIEALGVKNQVNPPNVSAPLGFKTTHSSIVNEPTVAKTILKSDSSESRMSGRSLPRKKGGRMLKKVITKAPHWQ